MTNVIFQQRLYRLFDLRVALCCQHGGTGYRRPRISDRGNPLDNRGNPVYNKHKTESCRVFHLNIRNPGHEKITVRPALRRHPLHRPRRRVRARRAVRAVRIRKERKGRR